MDDACRTARLLAARGDLAEPPPADLAALHRRAAEAGSIAQAVADLPTAPRLVLDALALVPGADDDTLLGLTASTPTRQDLADAVQELEVRLLLAPGSRTVAPEVRRWMRQVGRLGHTLRELYAPATAHAVHGLVSALGLAPERTKAGSLERLQDHFATPQEAAALLGTLRPELLDRLRELDAVGPVVAVPGLDAGRGLLPGDDLAAAQLVRAGLVVPRGGAYVEVPAEVALGLRHPTPLLLDLAPREPAGARPADADTVAASGAGSAHDVVDRLDRLVVALEQAPLPLLASGGVGVRELRRLGAACGLDHADVATLLELVEVLGLLKLMTKEVRLTKGWDAFAAEPASTRWARLARAWTALPIRPSPRTGKARPALASWGDHEHARLRPRLLTLLREQPDTAAPPAVWAFRYDRRWYAQPGEAWTAGPVVDAALVTDLLAEAALLGLVADGAPTPLVGLTADDLDALDDVGVQAVRAQADGTIVCTGMPSRQLRADLDALAAVESRGAATVWRLTEGSLVRAYGDGWTAEQARAALLRWAGELPQAMSYLVDDAARRAGRLRTGAAGSYLVAEDAAALADAMRVLKGVALTRVSDTVAVSTVTQDALDAALDGAGLAAGSAGRVARAAPGKRAPAHRDRRPPPPPPLSGPQVQALADRLVAGR